MQYLVIAHDFPNVLEKRMSVRPLHLARVEQLVVQKKVLYGIGLVNESQQLIGSVMLFDVSSRDELDAILKEEVYITAGVWDKVVIELATIGHFWKETKL